MKEEKKNNKIDAELFSYLFLSFSFIDTQSRHCNATYEFRKIFLSFRQKFIERNRATQ